MRSFNSAMMLSDVLAERENHIRIKEELARLEQVREMKYHETMKYNHERILEREENERIQNKCKKLAVAKVQKEQLQAAISRKQAEIEAERHEGFALRMEYQKQLEDDEQAAKADKDREIKALNDTRQAQKYLLELKARNQQLEAAQNLKIEEYARRQEEIETKRRDRQKTIFDEKLKIRQKMIDSQAARLAEMRDTSDKRTEKQCREVADKMDRLEIERREYQDQLRQNMGMERKDAIERKERTALAQREAEKQAAEYMNSLLKKLDEQDHEREIGKKQHAKQIRDELVKQMNEKQQRFEEESALERAVIPKAREIEEERLETFTRYAECLLGEYADQGRNIVPMVNSLKIESQ